MIAYGMRRIIIWVYVLCAHSCFVGYSIARWGWRVSLAPLVAEAAMAYAAQIDVEKILRKK